MQREVRSQLTTFELPIWAYLLMGLGLIGFIALTASYVRRNHGVNRPLFASPYVLWIIIFTVVPCLLVAYYAFTDVNGTLTLDNFAAFWDSNYLARKHMADDLAVYAEMGITAEDLGLGYGAVNVSTLVFSVWMAFLCTVACLLLGYPAAHFMAERDFKAGPVLIVLFIVPMWMNFLLRTVALMELMESNGIINSFLEWVGIGRLKLLNTSGAVLFGMIYNFLPFMVFPIYNVLNKMDYKLSEAAMDLGCNKWQVFYKVTMPLSVPGVVSGITMVFMPAVTTFYISRLLGGSKVQLFGDLIESKFLSATIADWNPGSAMSLIMMILMLISIGILRKVDPEGEGGGAV